MYRGTVTFSSARWIMLVRVRGYSWNARAKKGSLVRTGREEDDERAQVETAQRDPTRFAELYEQNFYRVYAYILQRVADRHQAEDLTTDVFQEALAEIGNFEFHKMPFATWLV